MSSVERAVISASAPVFLADFRGKMKICFDIFLLPSLSFSSLPLLLLLLRSAIHFHERFRNPVVTSGRAADLNRCNLNGWER